MAYYGTYNHQVDENGRFRIPNSFKQQLGTRYTIMLSVNKCLCILKEEQAKEIFDKKFGEADPTEAKNLKAIRYWYSNTTETEDDKQGRTLVPLGLREKANISKNVVIVGVGKWFEVWDEQIWKEYNSDDYDDVMAEFNTSNKAK